ncbi:MAG: hemolysin III family protein [Pseudomonadales bacterium]|nr:hemolysin III family protein [Pseudomonadales bacterium]
MYYGEKLNSISHLVGAVFALVALGALLTISLQTGEPVVIFSFSVFGLSLVLLYSMSTLYHSFYEPKLKRIFRIWDHIAIYLLIAGTYTPIMLISLQENNGWFILGVVWSLAAIGIISELTLTGRTIKVFQIIIYLAMGWACSMEIAAIKVALPGMGFHWLLIGGVAYTAGIVFYIIDKLNWLNHAHGIWHFFVLLGSVAHFIVVAGFVR